MLETSVVIALIVTIGTLVGLLFKLCFASKCDSFKFGCLQVHRNTAEELKKYPSTPQV